MVVRVVNSIFASTITWVPAQRLKLYDDFVPDERSDTGTRKNNSSTRLMHWISLLLLGLTAGLFLYIMVLETFLTDSRLTARTFNMSIDELRKPALNTAMKNLGVYNGLVGAGLLYALLFSPDGREVAAVFFAFCLVVAIYGAISSQFSILFKQGTLPFLGLVSLVLL